MRLFRRRTKDWCLAALEEIEGALALGIHSSSNPAHGSLGYRNIDEANAIVEQLNARIDEIDDVRPRNRVRRGVVVVGVRGW